MPSPGWVAMYGRPEIKIEDMYAMKFSSLWSAFRREHISLWMLCIYFMFEYVRPQTLYPELDILPWPLIFLLATLISAIMDGSAKWVSNVENRLLILFAVIVIISGIFSFRPSVSLDKWQVFGSWFISYFLIITIVNTEKRMILFLLAYCLFSLKMSQHGALTWAERGFSFATHGLVGSPGYFKNSGEYAIQMLIYGSLSISIVISLKGYFGRYKKWIFYALAATGYMAVMGASSRGAQLALLAMALWAILKQDGGWKGVLAMAVAGAVLFYVLPDEQMKRFQEMGQDGDSLQRLAYWEYALTHIVPEYPVLGIGYYNWLTYLGFMEPNGIGPFEMVQVCHNIFIEVLSEMGVIGLFVYLLLIVYAFKINARTRDLARGTEKILFYNLSLGLDAGLIAFLVAGSFVTVTYYPFFWVQIAMIVMLHNVTSKHFSKQTEPGTMRFGQKNI